MKEKHPSFLQKPARWFCPFEECKCHKPGFRYEVHFNEHMNSCHSAFMREDRAPPGAFQKRLRPLYSPDDHVGPGWSSDPEGRSIDDFTRPSSRALQAHDTVDPERRSLTIILRTPSPAAQAQDPIFPQGRWHIPGPLDDNFVDYTAAQAAQDSSGNQTDQSFSSRAQSLVHILDTRPPWTCIVCSEDLSSFEEAAEHVWIHSAERESR